MAAPQLRRKTIPAPYGEPARDAGNARGAADRFMPDHTLTQFHFATPADPVAERRRALGGLTVGAIAVVGAVAGVGYFAGMVAAAITAAAVVALAGFGNWVLNHTIDL